LLAFQSKEALIFIRASLNAILLCRTYLTYVEGVGISPLAPNVTLAVPPFELFMRYHPPSDGRHTSMSALQSPS
jgi:hypothetical protein